MPNQNLKAAKKLVLSQEGSKFYTGKVGENKSERLYKLRVSRSSNIGLSMTGLKSDANLELLNRQGKVLGRSAQKGRMNESITETIGKGVYYVRVSQRRGNTRYRLGLSVDSGASAGASATVVPTNSWVQQVFDLTNSYRQQAGLAPLRLNAKLNTAAQAHSVDMALNDFFSHIGSDGSTVYNRMNGAGYDYNLAAENIVAGYATPKSAVQAWMNSPGHRANILHPNLQEIGIGFYFLSNDSGSNNYRYYWTQDFGTID